MAKQLQLRRGTTAQHSAFTGALGEVTVDTDKKILVVHDGSTAGGIPLAKQATVDTKVDKVTSTDNAIARYDGTSGAIQNSGVVIDDSGNINALGHITSLSGQVILNSNSNNYLYFKNGSSLNIDDTIGNNRMRVASSGNLLLGTTTDNGVDKLQVNGSISATGGVSASKCTISNKTLSYTSISLSYNTPSKYIQIKTNCGAGNAAHIMLSGFCYTPYQLMKLDCAAYSDAYFTITHNIVRDINGNGVTGSWYKSVDNKLCLELVATTTTGFSGSLLNIDLQRTLYSPSLLEILASSVSSTQSRY